jgi:dienelactone hydrolase/pimeloyl-ACP methyl ester carboxylesterase
MRRTLALAVLLCLPLLAVAQEDLTVLKPDTGGVPPRKMLYAFLQAEAKKHFDARRQAIAALKTPDDLKRRQQELRSRFLEALGGFPEKTPLNARIIGTDQGDGYRLQRVVYESRPDHHVTALFYLPEGKGPFPGLLMPCGHSVNGKAADLYQRACILMAKNGLAVLCYDPIGQGERVQLLDRQGKPAIAGSTSEHTMAGVGALLVGSSTATYRIWDGIRSLDYLASRPEVDPQRLGCTGNSGGGTLTAYLMALDDRIAAAVPSCYITSLERLFATIGPQDAEQNITGQVAFGMEHADYLTMRAPRPTLMCVATQDFFDIDGAWTSFREAKRLYGLMGYGERMDIFEYNDKHGFSKPRREAAVRWLRRWLLHHDDAVVEGDFPIKKDAELQCTRTGQVLEDFKGKSVFDLNAERQQQLASGRNTALASRTREEMAKEVHKLLGLGDAKPLARRKPVGQIKRDGVNVEQVIYETEPGIAVPALEFRPKKGGALFLPLVLYVHGEGKAVNAGPGGPLEKMAREGKHVVALDLRGLGETAPGVPAAGKPNYFGTDEKEAFLALHLNRPLLGQRVYDLLAVLNALTAESRQGAEVIGVGTAAPVVLHAAVLEPGIEQVTLERGVVSWSAVVRTPVSHNQLTNVVPGALRVYDLPDLAALLAPRPLTIRAAVDPVGEVVSQEALERVYGRCKKAYEQQKAGTRLALEGK